MIDSVNIWEITQNEMALQSIIDEVLHNDFLQSSKKFPTEKLIVICIA